MSNQLLGQLVSRCSNWSTRLHRASSCNDGVCISLTPPSVPLVASSLLAPVHSWSHTDAAFCQLHTDLCLRHNYKHGLLFKYLTNRRTSCPYTTHAQIQVSILGCRPGLSSWKTGREMACGTKTTARLAEANEHGLEGRHVWAGGLVTYAKDLL